MLCMSGKRLLARTGLAAALGILIFLFISAASSQATPIKPDVQRMIRESQQSQKPFIPARAGWTEPASTTAALHNPVLESLKGDNAREEFRETLALVATPDPWLVVALVTIIVLMRKLRLIEENRKRAALVPVGARNPETEEPLAA